MVLRIRELAHAMPLGTLTSEDEDDGFVSPVCRGHDFCAMLWCLYLCDEVLSFSDAAGWLIDENDGSKISDSKATLGQSSIVIVRAEPCQLT